MAALETVAVTETVAVAAVGRYHASRSHERSVATCRFMALIFMTFIKFIGLEEKN